MTGRTCTRCEQAKPAEAFLADARYAGGLRSWCKACYADYKQERRDRYRALERAGRYGISPEAQLAMWEAQEGRCAACRVPLDVAAHLDHDHATGVVRGFLCAPCNHVIGRSGESVDRLLACVAYLLQHQEVPVNAEG